VGPGHRALPHVLWRTHTLLVREATVQRSENSVLQCVHPFRDSAPGLGMRLMPYPGNITDVITAHIHNYVTS